MSHQITVQPGGQQFVAEENESLLEAALRQGYTLPYGCKDGACGACRGKVLSGDFDHGNALESALPASERAAGQALFCCAKARSDLSIESRQITSNRDFPVKTLPSRIERLEKLAPDVMEIALRLPSSEKLNFHAGQYIDILLKDGKRRSFSLANAPGDDALLVLHVRLVPGGLFTEQVFNSMKVKDILRLNGPLGSFYLRDESKKPIIFLAGGTGFAPIKSIIEESLLRGQTRPMHLYWGARAVVDLYQTELPTQWASANPHIRYTPVLSEPGANDVWTGRTGLVHRAILEDFPNLADYQVYACGSPAMIDAARADFTAAGLPLEEFFADAFSFSTH